MNRILFVVVAMLFVLSPAMAQGPNLAEPYPLVLADGSNLDVQGIGHSAPVYADFDGDEVPDLIVGEFKSGACRIFKNYGSARDPVFKDFKFMEAGGTQATVPPS